jgi:competence protein ComEC
MQGFAARGGDWLTGLIEAERGRWFLLWPVAMTAGVVGYFALTLEPPLWGGLAVVAMGLVLCRAVRGWMVPCALCQLGVAVSVGFASAQAASFRAAAVIEIPAKATVITGVVAALEILPNGRRVLLEAPRFDGGSPQGRRVRVRLRAGDAAEIVPGDTLQVRALLARPAPPAYPGAWDLQLEAYFSGLGGYGTALGPSAVVAHPGPGSLALAGRGLREAITSAVLAVLPGSEGAIAATLLTGSSVTIPPADRAAFRDSGLAHLLAIAGLHIGIVMGLVFGAMRMGLAWWPRAALFWPCKAIAAVAALCAGAAYLGLTGAHVPIIRSFAMACLVTLGVLAGRRALSVRGLGLAMAAVVLISPNEVIGVSFQMSFSAVLALIAGYELLRPWLSALHGDGAAWRWLAGHVAALALTSALAGTFSAPYAAYHFGQIQIYFILANMVAVPITAVLVMPAGLIALVLMPLHLGFLALVPMGWGISAILWIARTVAALPAATLMVPHLPGWGLVVFSLGLGVAGIFRTRLRLVGVPLMLLGLVAPVWEVPPDILVSADARLIALRQGGRMLVQKGSGASGFTLDAWRQYWAIPVPQILGCATAHCLLQPRSGGEGAVLVRGAVDEGLCGAGLLISAEPIRLRCPELVTWIDRFTVWREGAQAVWLGASGAVVVSDRSVRGERPWVLGPPLAGKVPAGTVPALVEPLPEE